MDKNKVNLIFDVLFLFLFVVLLVGTPLIFTAYTRSVFEVNKLLLLRYVTIFTYVLWLTKYLLFKDNGLDNDAATSYNFLSLRWQKIGLEIPILLWLGLNVLSTIFATNIEVAIIGAYDRWEGIITIVNYMLLLVMFAKLVTSRCYIPWLVGAVLGSTALSAAYGVRQSLGYDFMHWSVDPTQRVFACINNPVHFCAYMAMVVPLALSWILFLQFKNKNHLPSKFQTFFIWLTFISMCVIYYAQYLSFSKATWLGFVGAMTIYYLYVSDALDKRSAKLFTLDFLLTSFAIGLYYIAVLFRVVEKGYLIAGVLITLLCAYTGYSFWLTQRQESQVKIQPQSILKTLGICLVLLVGFIIDWTTLNIWWSLVVYICTLSLFGLIVWRVKKQNIVFLERLIIILLFANLQFITNSFKEVLLYFALLAAYWLLLERRAHMPFEKIKWLGLSLVMFGLIIIIPSTPLLWANIKTSYQLCFTPQVSLAAQDSNNTISPTANKEGLAVLRNVNNKVNDYKVVAIKGTARTSMWKSAVPWIKDYWLLGSGPDTVKYMYPKYRRSEYGILEGGHNFTPDRLHNEYINTLATRGIPGFLIYYGALILGWYFLVCRRLFKMAENNPYRYLAIGFIVGASVYLGQVFFNFGVVATLVLFYVFMGLAQALVSHSAFQENQ